MVVIDSAESSGARRKESRASRVSSLTSGRSAARARPPALSYTTRALAHLDGAVGRLAHQVEVVGRHDHHGAAGVDVAQELEDAAGGSLVEVAGRLVGDAGCRDRSPAPARSPPAAARRPRARADRPGSWPRGRPGSAPASPGRRWCRAGRRSPRARRRCSRPRCDPPAGGSPGTRRPAGGGAGAPRRRGARSRCSPETRTSPLVGRCSANSSFMMVDLPAPEWPVRKTNSPLADPEGDVLQGQGTVGIRLCRRGRSGSREMKLTGARERKMGKGTTLPTAPASSPR